MIEQLEQRKHLSATLIGNVLTIVGTSRSDDIAIAAGREAFVVHDNGTQTAFATRQVRTIRIFGLAGDDSIIVSPRLTIRCSIEAGTGNDRVGGGAGNDTIFGGRGNDTLVGNGGDDYIDAGADDDRLHDTLGANVFHGGGGNDRVVGDAFGIWTGVEDGSLAEYTGVHYFSASPRISVENGRILMKMSGSLPSTANSVETTGPTLRDDGRYDVTATYNVVGGGAIVGGFDVEWDVTDAVPAGIIFTLYDSGFAEPTYSVPLFMPTS